MQDAINKLLVEDDTFITESYLKLLGFIYSAFTGNKERIQKFKKT